MESQSETLIQAIERILTPAGATDGALQEVLLVVLKHTKCPLGTLHVMDPASGMLQLRAEQGLPASLRPRVESIPVGKGMAGLAAQRREPVQVCNLQTDTSGVAKPGARETRMEGSIAVPMLADGDVRGVLGVARPTAHTFTEEECQLLSDISNLVARFLGTRVCRPER